ncbi:MAG: site-2 protease family protein, partial [Youngiibacter sp.]|nr:site-2 protease family protein [Youngiibacter sp.]
AFLSVNLAVLNLIPFPALDGGWLLILVVELVTKKKLPEKFVGIWNTVGFVVLMSFMALITFKDLFFPIQL